MAMTMSGEIQLPASRDRVAELTIPRRKATIPGWDSLEKPRTRSRRWRSPKSDRSRRAGRARSRSPISTRRTAIVGEGEGGVAGFAKGSADVKLSDKDGGTLLTYNVDAQIGGKLAQLGQRLINGAAKKMADEFFQKFAAAVGNG